MRNASGEVVRGAKEAQRNEFGMNGVGNVQVVKEPVVAETEKSKPEEPQVKEEPNN